ncbi:hypothetical protein Nm8I071_37560 [Nonomuraea sp. TT08I-71]|nr:hypothetical protein Nm8I071_37560 [Nonomuraea sp. TT08I-71]
MTQVAKWVAVVAGTATVFGLVFNLAAFAQDRRASFVRLTGWLFVVAGFSTAASVSAWLVADGFAEWHRPAPLPAAVAVLALAVAAYGIRRVVGAPVKQTVHALHSIAISVRSQADRLRPAQRWPIDLYARAGNSRLDAEVSLAAALTRPSARITVLSGPSGAGKTSAMLQTVCKIADSAVAARSPRIMATYVDLAGLDTTGAINADAIRQLICATVAGGNATAKDSLDRILREAADRPRWNFYFDGIYDAAPSQAGSAGWVTSSVLTAIQQFIASSPAFHGVVAVRDDALLTSPDAHLLTVTPLPVASVVGVVKQAALSSPVERALLARLNERADFADVLSNPLLLACLCDRLATGDATAIPETAHEIVHRAVRARLSRVAADDADLERSLAAATWTAYLTTVNPQARHTADSLVTALAREQGLTEGQARAALHLLLTAGIARTTAAGRITFVHRAFQDHYCADWVMQRPEQVDARSVLTGASWREPIVTVLHVGPEALRKRLVETADLILAEEVRIASGLVPDVEALLATPATEPLPFPSGSFTWPTTALHVLRILLRVRTGATPLSTEARERVERLVVSAFYNGTILEYRRALDILPLVSPRVAVWSVDRAMVSNSERLRTLAADRLADLPAVYGNLRMQSRLMAVASVAADPIRLRRLLSREPAIREAGPTLRDSVRVTVIIGQLVAGLTILLFGISFVREVMGTPDPYGLFAYGLVVAGSLVYLWMTALHRRLPDPLALTGYATVVVAGAGYAVSGVRQLLAIGLDPAGLTLMTSVEAIVRLYLYTLPVAAAVYAVVGPQPTIKTVAWPQAPLIRIGLAALRERELVRYVARRVRDAVPLIVAVGAFALAGSVPLPATTPEVDTDRRAILFTVIVAAAIVSGVLHVRIRQSRLRRTIRQQLQRAAVDEKQARDWLWVSRTTDEARQVLRILTQASPAALQNVEPLLSRLNAAFERVLKLVPENTTKPIPAAVWDVPPDALGHDMKAWLVRYDKRYPGRLQQLARSCRDDVAHALDRLAG